MRSFILIFVLLVFTRAICKGEDPIPKPWPEQFHAMLYVNLTTTGKLQIDDLWYDLPNGRNFNILQGQLSEVLYDLEWDNGTSFYYTLGDGGTCRRVSFPVGLLRPDFLSDATYLGRVNTDGFLCDLWQKLDFIWYYEDVASKRPVRWDFFTGMSMHVMTFEVGAVLPDPAWQAPVYCFPETEPRDEPPRATGGPHDLFRQLSLLIKNSGKRTSSN
ncbi:uncharacterized protein At4g14100-like [Wolffia australiana]